MKSAVICAALCVAGCSDWSPVKNAHDVEGQLVRVETKGKETQTVDEVVLCDTKGFIFAGDSRDCKDEPFDVRKDKVFKHDRDSRGTVGLVVTGILTAIFVPVAIVGSQMLGGK
jgi:hypothetical protein